MSEVEFKDFSVSAKLAIGKAGTEWVKQTATEMKSQIQELSRVNTGQTKGAYDFITQDDGFTAIVGNPLENAIWEEYGTGEYAINGNGRKGGWWIHVGNAKGDISEENVLRYHFYTIEWKGEKFAFTRGKHANRPMKKAFDIVAPTATAKAVAQFGKMENSDDS